MKRGHLLSAALVAASLLLVLFFHQGHSDNPMSRALTVASIVERHSMAWDDDWADATEDKAIIGEHVYGDKAPLSSLVVVPFYWLHTRLFGRGDKTPVVLIVHMGDVIAAAVPFALFVLLLFRRAKEGTTTLKAVWIALLAAFSTSLFNYSNMYFGHMLGGILFLGSYVLAVRNSRLVLAGFIGGASVLAEYPLALLQAGIALYLVLGPEPRRRTIRYLAGAAVPALAMLALNASVTGKPFDFPYSHVSDTFAPMKTAFGIRLPYLNAMWELLFGQFRGLLFFGPSFFVLIPLMVRNFDGDRRRRALAIGLCASLVLLISSYFKWNGGSCVGPRHLTPIMMLIIYEGVGALAITPRATIWFGVLAIIGVTLNLEIAATIPTPDEHAMHPLFEVIWPALARNGINRHNFATELGVAPGRYLLAVWVALFALLASGLSILARRADRKTLDGI